MWKQQTHCWNKYEDETWYNMSVLLYVYFYVLMYRVYITSALYIPSSFPFTRDGCDWWFGRNWWWKRLTGWKKENHRIGKTLYLITLTTFKQDKKFPRLIYFIVVVVIIILSCSRCLLFSISYPLCHTCVHTEQ